MTETLDPTVSLAPFPGLRSFYRSEFDIFFGRDDHVSEMVEKLSEYQFLCITGPSGCGKSSLARTGLFNALEAGFLRGRGSDWIFCDLYPQTNPLERLCTSLATAIIMGESGRGAPEPGLENEAAIAELRNLFLNHITMHSSDLNPAVEKVTAVEGRPIAILVDQFEEIFRYAQDDPDSVSRFVDVLLKTAAVVSDVYVIITIRTDQLEKCARYPGLTGAINQSQFLTPTLDRFQMQEAIEGPMSLFDGNIAPDLTIWMLNGLEEQLDKLPLMQHALRLLYEDARKRMPEGAITIGIDDFYRVFQIEQYPKRARSESHEALRTSLSHRLDTFYNRLDKRQRKLARGLFCALTTMESQGRDIRRPLALEEATATLDCTLDELLRVIGVFRDGADTYLRIVGVEDGIDEHDLVDVTHECILRLWNPLQTMWLRKEHAAAESIQHLGRTARDRERDVKGGFFDRLFGRGLLSGDTRKRYSKWWSEWKPNATWAGRYLEDLEWYEGDRRLDTREIFKRIDTFTDLSRKHSDVEKYVLMASAAAFTLIGAYAVWQQVDKANLRAEVFEAEAREQERLRLSQIEAEKERERRQKEADAWNAIVEIVPSRLELEPLTLVDLGISSLDQAMALQLPTGKIHAAHQKLITAMSYVREYRRFDHRPTGGGNTPTSRFLPGRDSQVYDAVFGPGAQQIVTLTDGLQLALWDTDRIEQPERVVSLADHQTTYPDGLGGRALAISPDGTLAVGTQRGAVLLVEGLDAGADPPKIKELHAGPEEWNYSSVFGLAFSRDGRTLISGALSGDVMLWRRGSEGAWQQETAFRSIDVLSRARGDDESVLLGQRGDDESLRLEQSQLAVWSVDLSPDASFAAMSLGNGTLCIATLDGQAARCRADGHEVGQAVKVVRFAPDGQRLYSAGNDDRVRIWSLDDVPWEEEAVASLPLLDLSEITFWHDSDIWDLDFSPDGRLTVTAAWDGALSLFETETGKPLSKLRGHTRALRSVTFAPNGRQILSTSLDGTARLWTPFASRADELGLTDQLPLEAPGQRIRSIAFGPAADWVAAAAGQAVWLKEAGKAFHRLDHGDGAITRVSAPAARDVFVAAMGSPEVLVARKNTGSAWDLRRMGLEADGYADRLIDRYIAVSDDGARYATNIKGPEGYAVLVCAVDEVRCGIGEGAHIALVPFPREIDHGRSADHACSRPGVPSALALSPNGKYLAIGGSDCNVRLFDLDLNSAETKMVAMMTKHVGTINALDFAHDGAALVSGSADWMARYWRLSDEDAPQLRGHRSSITDVRFLPGVHRVATVSGDERLIIWEAETRRPFLEVPGFFDTIEALDITMAGDDVFIAAGTGAGDLVTQRFFDDPSTYRAFVKEALAAVRQAPDQTQDSN